jgi:hypothetical protein
MIDDQPVAIPSRRADAEFRSLYAKHLPALLRLATALTDGDRQRAEDSFRKPCCGPGPTATTWTSTTAHLEPDWPPPPTGWLSTPTGPGNPTQSAS